MVKVREKKAGEKLVRSKANWVILGGKARVEVHSCGRS